MELSFYSKYHSENAPTGCYSPWSGCDDVLRLERVHIDIRQKIYFAPAIWYYPNQFQNW